jgi:arylsulfatase
VAPQLVQRALAITAVFDTQGNDGVIVAQGGLAHGYAIYVQDGEIFFALRRNNALTLVSGGKVMAGRRVVTATLAKDGALSVALDGQAPATGKAAGTLILTPIDGLDVGADRGASVGNYTVPNSFGGTIETVTVKTTI